MRYLNAAHEIMDIIGPGLMSDQQYEVLTRKIIDTLNRFENQVAADGYDEAEKRFKIKLTTVFEKLFLEDNDLVARVGRLEADSHQHDEDYDPTIRG